MRFRRGEERERKERERKRKKRERAAKKTLGAMADEDYDMDGGFVKPNDSFHCQVFCSIIIVNESNNLLRKKEEVNLGFRSFQIT